MPSQGRINKYFFYSISLCHLNSQILLLVLSLTINSVSHNLQPSLLSFSDEPITKKSIFRVSVIFVPGLILPKRTDHF